MPKISVIVPVYKVEPYLRRCVDSILSQSYRDFDLVLVDDGSPDACPCICDEYEDRDPRVHVIHRKNGGLSAARNSGIEWALKNSDSQWLTFIDSDDWIHRDFLKILLPGTCADAKISACGFERVRQKTEDGEIPEPEIQFLTSEEAYCRYYGLMMTACCKLVRKELYETLRFPEGKLHEDCYITHCLTFDAETVAIADVNIYYYYTNPQSITRSKWTPRRLDELEAHEQRLPYLQVRGYGDAFRRELEVYTQTVYEQAEVVTRLCRRYKKLRPYEKILREKLRCGLKMSRKQGLFPVGRGSMWMDLLASPAKPVWFFLKRIQKLRNNRIAGTL